jgi:hypothetical protein
LYKELSVFARGSRMATRKLEMKDMCWLSFLIGALALAVLTEPAAAQPVRANGSLEVGYAVTFWDVPIGHTGYEGSVGANSYSAKAHFETGGVIGIFWKSVIDATVSGNMGAHSIAPEAYDSHSQNHDKPTQQVKITYERNDPIVFADPPYDTLKYPVNEVQKKGTVDPMSALTSIFAGAAEEKGPCGSVVHVFDGRRRYDVRFSYVKDEAVKLGDGLFDGTAHLCEIHYDAIAGYPQRDAMAWQTSSNMFAEFIEVLAPGTPNGRYIVPVKLWSVRTLGTMTVTLDRITVNGAVPANINAKSG